MICNIAHRGASADAPEHTRAAYARAITDGADFLELDVRLTRDGQIVVLHDEILARTTDVAERFPDRAPFRVQDFTGDEIATLDAGAWFGSERAFSNQRLLTLDETLEIAGDRIGLWIETKPSPDSPDLEARLAEVLAAHDWNQAADRVVVQSFSRASVQSLAHLLPELRRFQLTGAAEGVTPDALDAVATYAHGIAPARQLVTPELVDAAHARGLQIVPWTVRDPEPDAVRSEMRRLLETGVDGIITDHPDLLTSVLRASAEGAPRA